MPTTYYQGAYFRIVADETGGEYVASSGDEVLIVPLTAANEVLLTIEPAPAFGGAPTLILPGGETAPNRTYAETANLELQEEIGFKAGQLDFLGELHPWSKYLAVRSFIYLGRDLAASALPGDEDYEIGIERVPLASFETLIAQGRLLDARVIAALFLARAFLAGKITPPAPSGHPLPKGREVSWGKP